MTLFFAYLLPLLLPTALYMLWRIWRERAVVSGDGSGSPDTPTDGKSAILPANEIAWRDAPWLWLAAAGIALMGVVVLTGVFIHEAAPAMRYVPPHIENGRVVPGELQPNGTGVAQPAPQAPREAR